MDTRPLANPPSDAAEDLSALPMARLVAELAAGGDALRRAMPVVQALSTKVKRVHGEHDPRLVPLDDAVVELAELLVPHLDAEEALYPALLSAHPDPAAVAREWTQAQREHGDMEGLLGRIRERTGDFLVPEWACNSYRKFFSELERLSADIRRRMQVESRVLRPRFPE